MVDQGGAEELAQQHEEDGIADPESRSDEGDRENVERDQQPAEKEVPRRPGGASYRRRAGQRQRQQGGDERDHEEDRRRRHRRAQAHPQRGVERGQDGNADAGGEHDEGVGGVHGHRRSCRVNCCGTSMARGGALIQINVMAGAACWNRTAPGGLPGPLKGELA